jgi:hypothetical protein
MTYVKRRKNNTRKERKNNACKEGRRIRYLKTGKNNALK